MKRLLLPFLALTAVLAGGATRIVQDQCGPFTDVTPGFCPYVLELYYLGITAGTSATTFSPDDPLTRGQGAVFIAKGLNQSLARSSRRAALGQWWTTTPHFDLGLGVTTLGVNPNMLVSDGSDIWVSSADGSVGRVRASDGRLLETWSAPLPVGILWAMGRVFVASYTSPGALYMIDPAQPAGAATLVASGLGDYPWGMAFDGSRIWTANTGTGGPSSVSIVTPSATLPWSVQTVSVGPHAAMGAVFDGTSVWVTASDGTLNKLDSSGAILLSVTGGSGFPAFDGQNIWAPYFNEVRIVSAASGQLVRTLTMNGLVTGFQAAFDGERVLITNQDFGGAALFRAADLTPLGLLPTSGLLGGRGVCSDGVNFWAAFNGSAAIGRF